MIRTRPGGQAHTVSTLVPIFPVTGVLIALFSTFSVLLFATSAAAEVLLDDLLDDHELFGPTAGYFGDDWSTEGTCAVLLACLGIVYPCYGCCLLPGARI